MADSPPLRVFAAGRTSTGRVRPNNEDNLWLGRVGDADARCGDREASGTTPFPGFLLAVADGMGGAKAGEVASRLAVETVAEEIARRLPAGRAPAPRELAEVGLAAVRVANDRIDSARHRARAWARRYRRGSCTAPSSSSRSATARTAPRGHLKQLTKGPEPSKLVDDGLLTEEEAERLPARHIILQALGSEEELEPKHDSVPVEDGDKLLLCTDGLSGLVKPATLEGILKKEGPLEEQCKRLIDAAEAEGGTDNITVLLARLGPAMAPR
jgi:protein phosphatase